MMVDSEQAASPPKKVVAAATAAAKIAAANAKILATDKTCLAWVKHKQGHNDVCRYCAHGVTPSVRWKFYNNVWYRWYAGKWHYYGPSRTGHGGAWKWFKGYWHYKGYVYRYINGKWERYYGGKWQKYTSGHVPQDPKPPTTPKTCIDVLKIVKQGLPDGLAVHSIPRCKSGEEYFMWEGVHKCSIIGGRKVFKMMSKCKVGSLHKFQKVKRCTREEIIKPGKFKYDDDKGTKPAKGGNTNGGNTNGGDRSNQEDLDAGITYRK